MDKRKYPFAVMDCDKGDDIRITPWSVHFSEDRALAEAQRMNSLDPNYHFLAVHWDASRWARAFWQDLTTIDEAREYEAAHREPACHYIDGFHVEHDWEPDDPHADGRYVFTDTACRRCGVIRHYISDVTGEEPVDITYSR